MLSQQQLSDRFELQDLVYRYAELIDSKQFSKLEEVFTTDAYIDYSALGGGVGNLAETIAYLEAAVTAELFPNTQHLNANVQLEVSGNSAKGRVMCFNPMEINLPGGGNQTFFLGLWYLDVYRRTDKGWRICQRREEKSWVFNLPDFMKL
jgi:3-phenylpropionate/cinnamic acid dioxygenase small subunit